MNLLLDRRLERRQQEGERHVEPNLLLRDVHRAADAGALEIDAIAAPGVFEREARLQIARDLLRGIFGFLVRKSMLLRDRYRRHAVRSVRYGPAVRIRVVGQGLRAVTNQVDDGAQRPPSRA